MIHTPQTNERHTITIEFSPVTLDYKVTSEPEVIDAMAAVTVFTSVMQQALLTMRKQRSMIVGAVGPTPQPKNENGTNEPPEENKETDPEENKETDEANEEETSE